MKTLARKNNKREKRCISEEKLNKETTSKETLLHGDVKTTANPTKHVSPAQNRNHKAFQTEIQTYLEVTQSSSVKKLNKHIQKQTIIKTCNQTITYAKEIGFG
jgi:hypothetical protein